jgi:hypothetical protein
MNTEIQNLTNNLSIDELINIQKQIDKTMQTRKLEDKKKEILTYWNERDDFVYSYLKLNKDFNENGKIGEFNVENFNYSPYSNYFSIYKVLMKLTTFIRFLINNGNKKDIEYFIFISSNTFTTHLYEFNLINEYIKSGKIDKLDLFLSDGLKNAFNSFLLYNFHLNVLKGLTINDVEYHYTIILNDDANPDVVETILDKLHEYGYNLSKTDVIDPKSKNILYPKDIKYIK